MFSPMVVVMVSWVYEYVPNRQNVYIKYVQLFVYTFY